MANGFRNDDFTADNSITTVTLNVDEVQVDNIGITGNSIISTDLNGDINIIPNGIGNLVLDGLKWPQADGTLGFILRTNGAGQLSWVPTGSGNVIGPAISTDNAIARYDLATGTLIQNSGVIIDDSNNVTGVAAITATTANATTITTNVAAAQLSMNGITISGSGSDANVGITLTPKGAGDLTLDGLKWPQADGTAGYVLKTNGTAQLSWVAAGSGDVVGPAASTDNAVVRFDLATGKVVQNSGVIIDDGNNVTGIVSLTATTANATTFDTNVAAAGVTLVGTTLSADGTDANIDVNVTPKGTGSVNISKANIDAGTIDGVTIGTSSACTELQVDNINVNGNSITSTNLNGSINITPNGTGDIVLDSLKWPQADGTANYVLKTNGSAQLSWVAQTTGDVVGPASATDNAIARYDLTTGKVVQNSGIIIDDTNNVTGIDSITANTANATTITTNVAAAQLSLNGITLSSIGTNPNIGITLTPKAAGDLTLDGLKWPQADGSAGYILKTNGAAQLSWIAPPTGTGDVVGPAGATANAIPRYNSTTGKLIKDSSVLIDDSNNVTGVGSLTATTVVSNTLKTTSGTMDLDSFSTGIVYNKNNGQTYFQTRNNVNLTTGGQISTVSVTLTGTAWTIVGPFITGSALVIVTSAMNGALNMVAVIVENTIGGAGSVNYPVRIGGNLALQISAGNLELKKPIAGFDGIYTVYVFGGNQLYP